MENHNVAVIGSGYVGLVTGICLAKFGNNITCADINKNKIDSLSGGRIPFYEPHLEKILHQHSDNIQFSTDLEKTIQKNDYIFIAVDTPENENGSANLQSIFDVAKKIGQHLNQHKVVVIKSTVPAGTHETVKNIISKYLSKDLTFDIVSNPEFLREGHAVGDFLYPDKIIIGSNNPKAIEKMLDLYQPLDCKNPLLMDNVSAEIAKYACNSMLANRISFINEITHITEKLGGKIKNVQKALASDHRIGPHFLNPGIGYGGSCFPKDVKALIHTAEAYNCGSSLLKAIDKTNQLQPQLFLKKVLSYFNSNLKNKKIAIWGASYKPETSDIRNAPALKIIEALLSYGAQIHVYDPKALQALRNLFQQQIHYADNKLSPLNNADALMILTEWKEFQTVQDLPENIYPKVIFDGRYCLPTGTRNLYSNRKQLQIDTPKSYNALNVHK